MILGIAYSTRLPTITDARCHARCNGIEPNQSLRQRFTRLLPFVDCTDRFGQRCCTWRDDRKSSAPPAHWQPRLSTPSTLDPARRARRRSSPATDGDPWRSSHSDAPWRFQRSGLLIRTRYLGPPPAPYALSSGASVPQLPRHPPASDYPFPTPPCLA